MHLQSVQCSRLTFYTQWGALQTATAAGTMATLLRSWAMRCGGGLANAAQPQGAGARRVLPCVQQRGGLMMRERQGPFRVPNFVGSTCGGQQGWWKVWAGGMCSKQCKEAVWCRSGTALGLRVRFSWAPVPHHKRMELMISDH